MHISLIIAIALFIIAAAIISRGIRIVPQQHALVVERFGGFHKILSPGLNLIIPLIDKVAYPFDMRERSIDISRQVCITKDNTQIAIDAIVFIQVTDAQKAAYGTVNALQSIERLAQTIMRNDVGARSLDEVLSSRREMNTNIVTELEDAIQTWGIRVLRYEIRDISPPKEIVQAMEKQITAEREKRAVISKSEGEQQAAINTADGAQKAAILKAEGEKQSAVLKAEGNAKAIGTIAEATKKALKTVGESLGSEEGIQAMNMQVAQDFISKWGEIAKEGTLVVVPTNMGDLSGTLASMLKIAKVANGTDTERPPSKEV